MKKNVNEYNVQMRNARLLKNTTFDQHHYFTITTKLSTVVLRLSKEKLTMKINKHIRLIKTAYTMLRQLMLTEPKPRLQMNYLNQSYKNYRKNYEQSQLTGFED